MLKPYYQDEQSTIYHGNCREILPDLDHVDLVITDPPYGMNYLSNYRLKKHQRIANDNQLPIQEIKLSILLAKNAAYIFCRWDNLKDMPPPRSLVCWVKNNWSMGDLEHEHARQWEAICFYPMDGHKFTKRPTDVLYADRTNNFYHPTEKPISIIEHLLNYNQGDVVLDPFMGSGTTLRAAKNLNRKAIGIELEEKYCETAAKRLSQEVLNFG